MHSFFRLLLKSQAWALYKYCSWQQLLTRYGKCAISGMGTSQPVIVGASPLMTSQVLTRGQDFKCMEETEESPAGKTTALVSRANHGCIFFRDPVVTVSNVDSISGFRFVTLNLEMKDALSCPVLIYRSLLVRFENHILFYNFMKSMNCKSFIFYG